MFLQFAICFALRSYHEGENDKIFERQVKDDLLA
jgi:hypothetical protein